MNTPSETQFAYPASWWESQSADQLQEYVRAGFMSGEMFVGAQRELERRARESARQLDQAAEEEVQHFFDLRDRVALGAAILSVLAAIAALIWVTIR
jgi:hypothetical protein